MPLNLTLILLCFMITFVQILYGQTCDCIFCFDTTTVPAAGEREIYNANPCPVGTAAVVSELNIESADRSGFQVYTKDDPSSSVYYAAGSSSSTVTCFKMGDGFVVGGREPTIYVIIECEQRFDPCPVFYNIRLGCRSIETTSTTSTSTHIPSSTTISTTTSTSVSVPPSSTMSTSISTSTFITVSTDTAVVFNNTCDCDCCRGSSACNPMYAGTIFYGTNKCETSDCVNQCAKQFSSCPHNKDEPGKIITHCINNSAKILKNIDFPILFLIIIFIELFYRI